MNTPHIWSAGVARRALMGHERTHNPSPAAASMLGKKRVKAAKAKARKLGRRKRHRGNPSAAEVASLVPIPGLGALTGLLGGLGGRFRKPSEVRAAALAPSIIQAANAGNLTAAAGLIERASRPMIAKEHAVWQAAAAQLSPAIVAQVKAHMKSIPAANQANPEAFAQSVMASPVQAPGAAAGSSGYTQLGAYLTPQNIGAVARAVTPRRSRRQRYPTYQDRYGRQRYSTKPPGSQMRLPAGATMAAGTPYNFFTGAVGKGGAAATAGQVAVAAAAGAAAYLVTSKLLQYLGGRAQKAEEAGVQAARALHESLEEYKQRFGKYPPPAERAEMKAAYRAKLVELGYNPDTFTRTRGAVAGFLEDYNPFGG
jgi:hypothetical protein